MLLIFSLVIASSLQSTAQECFGMFLFTQSDIDNLANDYPDCTSFDALFIIEFESGEITNLNGLSHVESIGFLTIQQNDSLKNLQGLENLNSLINLKITSNPSLENLDGLSSLQNIDIDLLISECPKLHSIEGLQNLSSAGGISLHTLPLLESLHGLEGIQGGLTRDLEITTLPSLTSLAPLAGVKVIGQNLLLHNLPLVNNLHGLHQVDTVYSFAIISQMESLETLEGLSNLKSAYNLALTNNESLQSLAGVGALTELKGSLEIHYNPILESLEGLENLDFVERGMRITFNATLNSLHGIEQVDTSEMEWLHLNNCPLLTGCAVQSVCDYLADSNRFHVVLSNAAECSSRDEILEGCLFLSAEHIDQEPQEIYAFPNPFHHHLNIRTTKGMEFNILDVHGRLVKSVYLGAGLQSIELTDLASGMYLLTGSEGYQYRIIKQ